MDPRGAHWQKKREAAGVPETKVCERCGSTYARPRSLRLVSWLERRFCGEQCRRAFISERMASLPPEQRGRRPRKVWTDAEFAERAACRRQRAAELARVRRARLRAERPPRERQRKACERCGAEFERRADGVTDAVWEARRYCSGACYHASRVGILGEEHPNWKGDDVKPNAGRRRARVLYPELGECNRCPSPAELRHHVDEDTLNNDPENIEFLCRPCHVEHHNLVGARWGR